MTEKRFEYNHEKGYKDYIYDVTDNRMMWDLECICELLNSLNNENKQLKRLLQNTSDQRDEFYRGARENANRVGKLKKENEQLKQQINTMINELQTEKETAISKNERIRLDFAITVLEELKGD